MRTGLTLSTKLVALTALIGVGGAGLVAFSTGRDVAEDSPPFEFDPELSRPFLEFHADLLHAVYSDSAALASALREAVDRLVATPGAESLEAARAAWIRARTSYLQSEIARFSQGPVDASSDAPERFMNAWPLDESILDYVQGAPAAGLVNDSARYPALDRATLRAANESGGETHITTGWHAIEFLLWGQDPVLGPGGGTRSPLDFLPGGGTAPNEARRGACLKVLAEMLEADLAFLREEWAPGVEGNYRAWFMSAITKPDLARILTGVGTLAYGELRGERLVVPFTLKDRENEHSCFSDTTHLDHVNDMIGVRNVWEGRYRSSDGRRDVAGTGLRDLALRFDPALAADVERRIDAAIDALRDPALIPFELAILGDDAAPGRVALQRALDRLAEFNQSFCALAARLGAPIGTTLAR